MNDRIKYSVFKDIYFDEEGCPHSTDPEIEKEVEEYLKEYYEAEYEKDL